MKTKVSEKIAKYLDMSVNYFLTVEHEDNVNSTCSWT